MPSSLVPAAARPLRDAAWPCSVTLTARPPAVVEMAPSRTAVEAEATPLAVVPAGPPSETRIARPVLPIWVPAATPRTAPVPALAKSA